MAITDGVFTPQFDLGLSDFLEGGDGPTSVFGGISPIAIGAKILSLGFGGGGLFGGGGGHEVNVGGLVVPSNMTGLGISTAPINAGSFRDFGAINQALVGNLLIQVSNISREFVLLGFKQSPLNLALSRAHLAVGRSATSPEHQRALNQNLINIATKVIDATAKVKADRVSYLAGSESERDRLGVFIQTNPANTREITNSFFELLNTPHELRLKRRLRDLSGKPISFWDTVGESTILSAIGTPVDSIAIPFPDAKLPTLDKEANVFNITVNVPQTQTTLPYNPFVGPPQPPQFSNPQTKASWWQKFITAGQVASGIHTVVTLPFTIRNMFASPDELPIFAPVAGNEEFNFPALPDFPNQDNIINPVLFLNEDGSYSIQELSDENIVGTAGTLSGKTVSYLLLGLLIAYLIAKRKGRK